VRTVILGPPPPEVEELIRSRRRTGADRFDEVWEGDLHMNPAPRIDHGDVAVQLTARMLPLARRRGLRVTDGFNLGVADDFRIPDAGVHRERQHAVYVPTAALVVEVLSRGDETYEKLPFYATHGVDEVVIADPAGRTLVWLRLVDGAYLETEHSTVLDVAAAELAAQIDWP